MKSVDDVVVRPSLVIVTLPVVACKGGTVAERELTLLAVTVAIVPLNFTMLLAETELNPDPFITIEVLGEALGTEKEEMENKENFTMRLFLLSDT